MITDRQRKALAKLTQIEGIPAVLLTMAANNDALIQKYADTPGYTDGWGEYSAILNRAVIEFENLRRPTRSSRASD